MLVKDSSAGLPGAFPPLAGSDWLAGHDSDAAIGVVLNGLVWE